MTETVSTSSSGQVAQCAPASAPSSRPPSTCAASGPIFGLPARPETVAAFLAAGTTDVLWRNAMTGKVDTWLLGGWAYYRGHRRGVSIDCVAVRRHRRL